MSGLARTLSLGTAISVVIGGVIGSGIFMKPALMASQLGSTALLLSVWVVAGIITLFGALSNAEVAAMFPETGGQYVFFREMYGKGFAFLYGWAAFAVFNTAGNASIAYVCAQYTNYFVELPRLSPELEQSFVLHLPGIGSIIPLENLGVKTLTICIIVLLTFINYRSVKSSAGLQRLLTALKSVAIFLLITGVLTSGKGSLSHFEMSLPDAPEGLALLGAYVAALSGAFWAYDGWNNITFVAGEIRQPQRNIPRSLLAGLLFCMLVYVLVNIAFIYVLPLDKMAVSAFVASDVSRTVWGTLGAGIITLMIIISTFGTVNANVLATARVTYALGEEHRAFSWAGVTQKRFQTPGNALWLNAAWSTVLILSGSFDMLTDMLIFVTWFFYGMSALGLIVLRFKKKDVERPYRVPGYPFVPVIFVLFTFFFLGMTVVTDVMNYQAGRTTIINSVLGIVITCAGLPLYLVGRKRGG